MYPLRSDDYSGIEYFFLICAAIGGFFVLVRLITQFMGADSEADLDSDLTIDSHHADPDVGFQFLSLHGLSAFFMMFGLVGLALYRQSEAGLPISLLGAVAAGLGAVFVIGKIFQGAAKLQVSGTLRTEDAIGSTGTVYLTIPEKGIGRVNVTFQNHLREFDAREKNGAAVPAGTSIRVVQVTGNILVVETIH